MKHTNAEQTQQCEVVSESFGGVFNNSGFPDALPLSAKALLEIQDNLRCRLADVIGDIFKRRIEEMKKQELDSSVHTMD
jgi:uncharacterized protein (DUF2164 family)